MNPDAAPGPGSGILGPTTGLAVLHLFCKVGPATDPESVRAATEDAVADSVHTVPVALLGHKADLGVVALAPDFGRLRRYQTALVAAGAEPVWSYTSLTEVSEYAAGVPEELKQARLYPTLPPEGKRAFCFYPMSKRRAPAGPGGTGDNWYLLGYDERLAFMHGHGKVGRRFAGRVLQLVTGSTGLDDWEWGVTLFAVHPDDLKACVYEMRFDEASARYAEFGPFVTGTVGELDEVLDSIVGGR